jgi:hypothetical protein
VGDLGGRALARSEAAEGTPGCAAPHKQTAHVMSSAGEGASGKVPRRTAPVLGAVPLTCRLLGVTGSSPVPPIEKEAAGKNGFLFVMHPQWLRLLTRPLDDLHRERSRVSERHPFLRSAGGPGSHRASSRSLRWNDSRDGKADGPCRSLVDPAHPLAGDIREARRRLNG